MMVFKEHIFFKNIQHRFTVKRSDDWGWLFADDNTFVVIYSFDRRLGQRLFEMPLELPDSPKLIRAVTPLVSSLMNDKLNEVYDVIPNETFSALD